MMVKRLTTKEYWEVVWEGSRLPIVAKPSRDVQRVLDANLPKKPGLRFLEIGCALGGWIVYFHKRFGYGVEGIEYADNAAEITRKNLEMQQVSGVVLTEDFSLFEGSDSTYDVVFSGGFIEHFDELDFVVGKICSLTTQYVITLVPNLFGLGGLISKTFRPAVYHAHKRIDTCLLRRLHEEANMETLFCDYVGGIVLTLPAAKNVFFEKRKAFSWIINLPFRALNLVFRKLNNRFGFAPRTRNFSRTLMYIGRRRRARTEDS